MDLISGHGNAFLKDCLESNFQLELSWLIKITEWLFKIIQFHFSFFRRLGNEKYKSKIVSKSLNPKWLEQFDLHLYDDQSQELEVTIWDKDRSKDDFMGR